MKKFLRHPVAIVTILALMFLVIYIVSNPLVKSEESIKRRLLIDVPIGTSMSDVTSYIRKKEYKIVNVSESGFPGGNNQYIGYRSIRSDLGDYNVILTTNVTVFWGFDEELKLIDIRVWKTVDGP